MDKLFSHRVSVALINPQIHWNTGNIGRTCLGFNARLHLVKPLGFKLDDHHVKRAGLDYWKHVDCTIHESFEEFESILPEIGKPYFFSKKERHGTQSLFDVEFPPNRDICLVFGSEITGFDHLKEIERLCDDHEMLYIPMNASHIRSLNLSTSVGMALFEASRQLFKERSKFSNLTII